MTEQEEFEFRHRYEQEQAQSQPPATFRQKLQSSTPMRVWQGMRDPIDAGAQLLPRGLELLTSAGGLSKNPISDFFGSEARRVDRMIADNEREYDQSRRVTGQDGVDASRVVGRVVSPANLAVATKLPAAISTGGRIATGMALGGVGGAMEPVNVDNNPNFSSTKAGQVALGAVTGGVLTPVLGKVGDFVGKQIAKASSSKPIVLSKTTEEYARSSGLNWEALGTAERAALQEQVANAARARAGRDPKALARIADFKAEGIPYTLGQVTRNPMQYATEKNLSQVAGVGDPLRERFSSQGAMLREIMGKYGVGALPEQEAGQVVTSALKSYDDLLAQQVRAQYSQARNSAGKEAAVPLQGLAQDFAEVLDTFGDKVPSAVRNNFGKYGIGVDDVNMTQRKIFTVEEADKLLKVINANQSNDPAVNAALSSLRSAVKRTVTQDAGVDDVFAGARKAAAERFSLQDALPALEASASGRANPDTFVQNYIISKTARSTQVRQMADVLKDQNPEAYSAARTQLGAYLNRKAFGENQAGDKAFSPERFSAAMREIGDAKLSAFFSPNEVAQMKRVSRIGAYMDAVPYASKPNTSGNWAAIMSRFPGMPQTLAVANAVKTGASNQLNVNRALTAQPGAELSPEQIRYASQLLGLTALSAGSASAQNLK